MIAIRVTLNLPRLDTPGQVRFRLGDVAGCVYHLNPDLETAMPERDLTQGRSVSAWEHGAHQLYYRTEDVPRLQEAVAALSVDDQMVFLRWYLDDTSLVAMGQLLGSGKETVLDHVERVRQAVWAKLGKPQELLDQEAKDRGFIGKQPIKTESFVISQPKTLGDLWRRRVGGKKRGWQTATQFAIIIPLVMYIIYDFVAYFMGGGEATLSTTTGNWLVKSFWIVLAVTLLVGHLFGSATQGAMTWRHFAVGAVGLTLGYLLTVMATS